MVDMNVVNFITKMDLVLAITDFYKLSSVLFYCSFYFFIVLAHPTITALSSLSHPSPDVSHFSKHFLFWLKMVLRQDLVSLLLE